VFKMNIKHPSLDSKYLLLLLYSKILSLKFRSRLSWLWVRLVACNMLQSHSESNYAACKCMEMVIRVCGVWSTVKCLCNGVLQSGAEWGTEWGTESRRLKSKQKKTGIAKVQSINDEPTRPESESESNPKPGYVVAVLQCLYVCIYACM